MFEAAWLDNYDKANYKEGLSAKVLRATHQLIERDARLKENYPFVLEVGAGTMAHFPAVRHDFHRYIASDGDTKVVDWLKERPWDPRVEIRHIEGGELPFKDNSVDRLIATHVLEHVIDPAQTLAEWSRVIRPGGVLSLILPSDPGAAWRLGRMFGPRRNAEASGLPYDYYMAIEHRNSIYNLRQIIQFHFPDRREKWWPLKLPWPDTNLIYGVNCFL